MDPLKRIYSSETTGVVVRVRQLADDGKFDDLEQAHPDGMSVQQIVEACAAVGEKISEATFRKYVQLGLLPRSVRVGKKGKHRGSQGLYPATAVRQIQLIRRLMTQGFTIEEIQTRCLFMRGDIDTLERELDRVLSQFERAPESSDVLIRREVEEARRLSSALLEKLRGVERRMSVQARMERAAV